MAYTTINKPTDYFNTKLYTGNGSAGHSITGVGHQPDLVWMKGRNQAFDQCWYDAVRGVTKLIRSNLTNAEATQSGVTAFGSDGFTLGSSGETNSNNDTYVAWNWKAGTTSGIATNGATVTTPSSYSFNQTSRFSILQYTGTGNTNNKLAHGLGVKPDFIIFKKTSGDINWGIYHQSLTADYRLLFTTGVASDDDSFMQDSEPDSVNINLGYGGLNNTSGATYIAYCFAEGTGFSKFGKYIGNGNATTPPFIYTGFKPALVITKISSGSTNGWTVSDIKRDNAVGGNGNGIGARVLANASSTEETNNIWASIQKYSNGFSPQGTDAVTNANGSTYIYAAFAAAPLVGTNDIPANAR